MITPEGHPVVNWGTGKFWANNHVHIIDSKPGIDIDYLYYTINNSNISQFVHGNIPKLTKGDLLDIEVQLPPTLQEQKQIASLLSSYDELIQLNRDKLSTVNKMKAQLMTQVFAERERERVG